MLRGVALALLSAAVLPAVTVRVAVFGLFHPTVLRVRPAPSERLTLLLDGRPITIEAEAATLSADSEGLISVRLGDILAQGRSVRTQDLAVLELEVPNRIRRTYSGALKVQAVEGELVSIVEMDLETATASATAAEADTDWPPAALAAQALVSRSYYAAGSRHRDFDFCDTTHCQYLRAPPLAGSRAGAAIAVTRGNTILYNNRPVRALFSQSCGGTTKTAADVGLATDGYPYFARRCEEAPEAWRRRYESDEARRLLLVPGEEMRRLDFVRIRGWDAVPSNAYQVRREGDEYVLEGTGRGHGLGLCQRGAVAMARRGADWRSIVKRYFPNVRIKN